MAADARPSVADQEARSIAPAAADTPAAVILAREPFATLETLCNTWPRLASLPSFPSTSQPGYR